MGTRLHHRNCSEQVVGMDEGATTMIDPLFEIQ
jgi:hypothetical protein